VAGGAALARDDGGRVVFVHGALPGEAVRAEITSAKRDFAHARAVEVVEASPDRIQPPCPYVRDGCGGCDLQHLAPDAQPAVKAAIVTDALRRLGRIDDPPVVVGATLPSTGFRTTVRAAVGDLGGRLGFRAPHSHEVVAVERCLVAHPLVDQLLTAGRYEGCDEVTIRVGAATGERLVIADPTAAGVELPDDLDVRAEVPVAGADVTTTVVGGDELAAGTRAWIHEVVDGHRFRISARSFFQTRPDGAAALVDAVRRAGGDELASATTVVDAYAGVGLFAALTTPSGARIIAVESSASSVADARINLVEHDAKIIKARVERWHPSAADVVIADPARAGLTRDGVRAITGTRAPVIVLVSCDAAALGRDAALLAREGYRLEVTEVVDLFPQTHHVEVVSRFAR
jgi:23S rRNA (uracil1939-C5)-methyltransferase